MIEEEKESRLEEVRMRLAALEARVEALEEGLARAAPGVPGKPAEKAAAPISSFPPTSSGGGGMPSHPAPPAFVPPPLAEFPPVPPGHPAPGSKPPGVPSPPRSRTELEKRIGVWLSRIGVVLVFFAAAFFLKLALDVLGPEGRVALGVLVGLVLTGAGEFAQRRHYETLGRALTGGGLAVLYLSVFAAFSFYDLIHQLPAFLLMLLITASGVTLSVRYNSQVIVILALLGGFLTPVLLSTGRAQQTALMSYMILLDVGLLGIAYWKRWRAVSLFCFFATLILFLAWVVEYYSSADAARTFAFATAFFLIFAAHYILYSLVRRKVAGVEDLVLITGNAVAYFLSMWALLDEEGLEEFLGIFAFTLAGLYLLQVRLVMNYHREDPNLIRFLAGLAVGFVTMAIPLQLEYEIVTLAWALEAVVLTWYGLYTGSNFIRILGVVVLVVAVGHLAVDFEVYEERLWKEKNFLLFRGIVTGYGAVIGALAAMSAAYRRFAARFPLKPGWLTAFSLGEVILGLIFVLVMNHYLFAADFYPHWLYSDSRQGSIINISLILSLYASIAIILGILYRQKWLRSFGLPVLCLALLKVVLYDMHGLKLLYRVISFLALGGLLIALSFLYQKFKDRLEGFALQESGQDQPPSSSWTTKDGAGSGEIRGEDNSQEEK